MKFNYPLEEEPLWPEPPALLVFPLSALCVLCGWLTFWLLAGALLCGCTAGAVFLVGATFGVRLPFVSVLTDWVLVGATLFAGRTGVVVLTSVADSPLVGLTVLFALIFPDPLFTVELFTLTVLFPLVETLALLRVAVAVLAFLVPLLPLVSTFLVPVFLVLSSSYRLVMLLFLLVKDSFGCCLSYPLERLVLCIATALSLLLTFT